MDEFERLEQQYRDGEISYDELVTRGKGAAERAERKCSHRYTTVKTAANGGWIEWCDDCAGRVASGGGGAPTVRRGGGSCAVAGVLLLGAVTAGVYGVVEVVRHLV